MARSLNKLETGCSKSEDVVGVTGMCGDGMWNKIMNE